jgi:DNA-binding protein HU-beta
MLVISSLLVSWNEHFPKEEIQMNRAELVENVAKVTGQPKSEVTRTLSAFIHTITGALSHGDKVTLVGFGTFERRMRKARTGRNPRTLAPLKIAAARVPAFRAGKELKDIVNGRAKQPTLVLAKPKAAAKPAAAKKAAAKPAKKAAAKPVKKAAAKKGGKKK